MTMFLLLVIKYLGNYLVCLVRGDSVVIEVVRMQYADFLYMMVWLGH